MCIFKVCWGGGGAFKLSNVDLVSLAKIKCYAISSVFRQKSSVMPKERNLSIMASAKSSSLYFKGSCEKADSGYYCNNAVSNNQQLPIVFIYKLYIKLYDRYLI